MIGRVHATHTSLQVVTSPVSWLEPGDEFTRGDIAEWLEDGDLPADLVLAMGHVEWIVARRASRWILEGEYSTVGLRRLTSAQLRQYNRGGRRHEVLAALQSLTRQAGEPPTLRELGAELGIVPSLAKYHIDVLARDGLVDKVPYRYRSAHLTEAGAELLETMDAAVAEN